jgi:hypothetical protein
MCHTSSTSKSRGWGVVFQLICISLGHKHKIAMPRPLVFSEVCGTCTTLAVWRRFGLCVADLYENASSRQCYNKSFGFTCSRAKLHMSGKHVHVCPMNYLKRGWHKILLIFMIYRSYLQYIRNELAYVFSVIFFSLYWPIIIVDEKNACFRQC